MSDRRRRAAAAVEQLPEEEQDRMVALIAEEIEEREWDAIVAKPHVRKALRRMAREAGDQDAAGETEEGGWTAELLAERRREPALGT